MKGKNVLAQDQASNNDSHIRKTLMSHPIMVEENKLFSEDISDKERSSPHLTKSYNDSKLNIQGKKEN